jgi:hypothetical protein
VHRSNHEIAVAQIVDQLLEDPSAMANLAGYVGAVRAGRFDERWVRVVVHKAHQLELTDYFSFAVLHVLLCRGELSISTVRVGAPPRSDREVVGNNRLLQSLAPPFEASVNCRLAERDGEIRWVEPIEATVFSFRDGRMYTEQRQQPPSSCALEVGYTAGTRTLTHLTTRGMVARWPYGSREITIVGLMGDGGSIAEAFR